MTRSFEPHLQENGVSPMYVAPDSTQTSAEIAADTARVARPARRTVAILIAALGFVLLICVAVPRVARVVTYTDYLESRTPIARARLAADAECVTFPPAAAGLFSVGSGTIADPALSDVQTLYTHEHLYIRSGTIRIDVRDPEASDGAFDEYIYSLRGSNLGPEFHPAADRAIKSLRTDWLAHQTAVLSTKPVSAWAVFLMSPSEFTDHLFYLDSKPTFTRRVVIAETSHIAAVLQYSTDPEGVRKFAAYASIFRKSDGRRQNLAVYAENSDECNRLLELFVSTFAPSNEK